MRVALYVRVSTSEERGVQDVSNQLVPLRRLAEALQAEIVEEYVDRCSGGDSNRPEFQRMLGDVRARRFDVLLVWALDRFSREGILNTLRYLSVLRSHNVAIKSLQESWLDTRDSGMGELLIAIFSWVAEREKMRISERVKAGLRGKRNVGKRGKDKRPRRRSGYLMRWQKVKHS